MAPMFCFPRRIVGDVLVKLVIVSFPVDQPVGIVHPRRGWQKMIAGAVRISGEHPLEDLLPFCLPMETRRFR